MTATSPQTERVLDQMRNTPRVGRAGAVAVALTATAALALAGCGGRSTSETRNW